MPLLSDDLKKTYGPFILKVAAWGAGSLLAILAAWLSLPAPTVVVQSPAISVKMEAPAVPVVTQGANPEATASRQGPARRLLANLIRHRVSKQLQKDGFKLVGGNPRPLTAAEADKLLNRLDDEQIIEGAVVAGGLGDGKILDAIGRLFDWIIAHQDQILAIIKWVMTLMMLFADDAPGVGAAPVPADVVAWHEPPAADLFALAT